jgi:hypothetical protein
MIHGRQVDLAHIAMYPDHRRHAGRQVKVGGAILDDEGKQFGNVHATNPLKILRRVLLQFGVLY